VGPEVEVGGAPEDSEDIAIVAGSVVGEGVSVDAKVATRGDVVAP
jgi:hypothetical protein